MTKFLVAVFFSTLISIAFTAASMAEGPTDCTGIPTDKGAVTGVSNKGICEYKGVPFAAPPVGELRFRLPQPAESWTEPLMADAFGPECYQTPMVDLSGNGKPTGSEDCLYLNMWVSQRNPEEKKPVMIFMHGGGFQHGSGIMDTYYGARLAATGNVVVVTINYRLGPFGFYMHPALTEPDGSLEGNYGIYDQIAAMKWVQDNISGFGGDPGNVTIFGESAGGMSVGMHLISPLAEGLFHKAIIESGPVFLINKSISDMLPVGESLAPDVGCDDPETVAECLRSLPAEDILLKLKTGIMFLTEPGKKKKFPSEPLYGGKLIPDSPFKMYKEGNYFKDITVMIGSNKDEFSFFVSKEDLDTREDFDAKITGDIKKLEDILGVNVFTGDLMEQYDPDNYETPKKAYADLMGDMAFTCPTRVLANTLAANGTPVYLYHFVYETEGVQMLGDWGAFHGSELPFIFGNMTFLGIKFPYKANKQVSTKIRGLWSEFARTGVPAHESAPEWPAYNPDTQPYMILDTEMKADAAFKKEKCEIFEGITSALFE